MKTGHAMIIALIIGLLTTFGTFFLVNNFPDHSVKESQIDRLEKQLIRIEKQLSETAIEVHDLRIRGRN